MIFTYDDSEEFLPVFIHFFDLKEVCNLVGSPLGSSLVCFRGQEVVVLSIEPAFKEIKYLVDGEIYDAALSPQENFLYLLRTPSLNEDRVKLEIREAKTGIIRKLFNTATTKEPYVIEPINFLKWNHDDNYIASFETNLVVVVYETKTFSEIESLMFQRVQEFSWSPSASILAVASDSNVKVVDLCSGNVLYKSSWKTVDMCKIFWEGSGDYIACLSSGNDIKKVFLISLKSGKAHCTTYPDGAIDFCWRGNGKDFAVTQGSENGEPTRVKFYTIRDDEKNFRERIEIVEGMVAHFLHWSPNGRYMVIQGPVDGGLLYFYDVDNHQRLNSKTFICSDLKWDSTSRFLLTQAHYKNWPQVVRIWSTMLVTFT